MKTFSFVAECDHDTENLPEILKRNGISGTIIHYPSVLDTKPLRLCGGWQVELKTDASKADILKAFEEIPDSHVMERTLEERPLFKNPAAEKEYRETAEQLIKELKQR